MSTTRRTFLGALLGTAATATLAGCTSGVPTISPSAGALASAQPVLSIDRLTEVLQRIQNGLVAADATKDAGKLGTVLAGPALRVRQESYALAAATGKNDFIRALLTDQQASVVALTDKFPRTAMTATSYAQGSNLPFLLVLNQTGPRDQYHLWGWIRLFPGAKFPATAAPSVGSAPVGAKTTGLVSTPYDALAAYVDALNNPGSANGKAFGNDTLRQQIAKERQVNDAVSAAGSVSVSAAAGQDGFLGLRTADNGAIVMTSLTYSTLYTRSVAGSTMRVSDTLGALMGGNLDVVGTVRATYDVMVALTIPAEGSKDPMTILGAEIILAKVERDDSANPG